MSVEYSRYPRYLLDQPHALSTYLGFLFGPGSSRAGRLSCSVMPNMIGSSACPSSAANPSIYGSERISNTRLLSTAFVCSQVSLVVFPTSATQQERARELPMLTLLVFSATLNRLCSFDEDVFSQWSSAMIAPTSQRRAQRLIECAAPAMGNGSDHHPPSPHHRRQRASIMQEFAGVEHARRSAALVYTCISLPLPLPDLPRDWFSHLSEFHPACW
ncbi:hypothetical protein HD806DRAFT_110529 [Xylariaceae sp. AK1471]|nr:hypothetical protein HD806DRAFT_110529 [Xylariaceae sp. AK1471]